MTTVRSILEQLDRGEYLDKDGVDGALADIQKVMVKVVKKARLDEVIWYSNHVGILHENWEKYEIKRKSSGIRKHKESNLNNALGLEK